MWRWYPPLTLGVAPAKLATYSMVSFVPSNVALVRQTQRGLALIWSVHCSSAGSGAAPIDPAPLGEADTGCAPGDRVPLVEVELPVRSCLPLRLASATMPAASNATNATAVPTRTPRRRHGAGFEVTPGVIGGADETAAAGETGATTGATQRLGGGASPGPGCGASLRPGNCAIAPLASQAAPRATACFGWASTATGRPSSAPTSCATIGIRDEPP